MNQILALLGPCLGKHNYGDNGSLIDWLLIQVNKMVGLRSMIKAFEILGDRLSYRVNGIYIILKPENKTKQTQNVKSDTIADFSRVLG